MARSKKIPFRVWETTKENGIENRYIRSGTIMTHSATKKLTHSAWRVYEYMRLESGGKRVFMFPRSKYRDFLSSGGFQSAKKELIKAGFIEEIENNAHRKKANVYGFLTAWKTIN